MKNEYYIFFFPIILGLMVIIYFIYHSRHAEAFSKKVCGKVSRKIEELESKYEISNKKTRHFVNEFKKLIEKNKYTVFEIERKLGIDLDSLHKKLEKEIIKKGSSRGGETT